MSSQSPFSGKVKIFSDGADKKAMAISLTFLDEEKTMTDKDIDVMMASLITAYEKELNAVIRK